MEEPSHASATSSEGLVDRYPTPRRTWALTFPEPNAMAGSVCHRFPFEDRSGFWDVALLPRPATSARAGGRGRWPTALLLTPSHRHGQDGYRLPDWHESSSTPVDYLSRQPKRGRPRILFLADRTFWPTRLHNAFSSFAEDARIRIAAGFHTQGGPRFRPTPASSSPSFRHSWSGTGPDGQPAPYFGQYPPDSSTSSSLTSAIAAAPNDESNWRDILNYFSPASPTRPDGDAQTPRQRGHIRLLRRAGLHLLAQRSINDGFLTPVQGGPDFDDHRRLRVPAGRHRCGRRSGRGATYVEATLTKASRSKSAKRPAVNILMSRIDQREKTLVFCRYQPHAALHSAT